MIIGGTGFLGYHITRALTSNGHQISIIALPPMPAEGLFPEGIDIKLVDVNQLSDPELGQLMNGHDAIIYAAGVDDRTIPKAPAYPFFYKHNVETTKRVFAIARQTGVRRGVLLSSYFLHFDRIWPHLELSQHHPYIRSRKEQAREAIEACMPDLEVMVLELGYIFGSMPGRKPLWAPLVNYLRSPLPFIFYPSGGTNVIAVETVAEAVTGALEKGEGGKHYTIGDQNMTWVEMLQNMMTAMSIRKKIITLPVWLTNIAAVILKTIHWLSAKESGLEPVEFMKVQTSLTFLDSSEAMRSLNYQSGDLSEAFRKTVQACQK
jgi:nucleoside-diphosphate-sugar epimerase